MPAEDLELLGGGGSPRGGFSRKLLYFVTLLFVLSLVATITLSVLYSREVKKTKEEETAAQQPAYDNSNDFPLSTPQAWDVTANHTNPLAFTTTNGTWLNIDVSPNGNEIVFDMLGDIYLLNLTGGNAVPLRTGPAFETNPRFSPDGTQILFTSDLSGCDNLWIMDLHDKAQTQVTFETYHWVSNGYWIDGNSVVAVKWYTSTRSIGAGEIWQYDIIIGEKSNPGKRLVGRTAVGSQVGPEEPVPRTLNGKTSIFYSKNIADGFTWTYSKDPHQTIYIIYEYDVSTQITSVIASGPGGSARPIVSHSGNTLAYIKRTVFQTSLVLHDLTTGNEEILYQNLDFDQQESSAPSGVYPGYAFTPDDSAIVIWAKGYIYSINVATGEATQIPFSVDVNLALAPTVRFPQIAEDGSIFATKIITTPSVSGDKQTFAFTSLAATYIYKPATSELTQLDAHLAPGVFQFWPSLSRDNQFLVQVVWSDQNLASIEVVNLSDLSRYTLPTPPGRYAQPQFSPSGNYIVYSRLSGDAMSGSEYSLNSGIYLCSYTINEHNSSITFGTPAFLSDEVYSAVFSESGKSILGQSGSYPLEVSEISTEEGTKFASSSNLAASLYSTEVAVSPNKKFVAFIEFQKVFIAHYEQEKDGKVMNVTSMGHSHVFEVTALGGQYLTWSYDSTTLYWVWGPMFYELAVPDLNKCHSFADCPGSEIKSYNVSIVASTELVTNQVTVFYNATILTMDDSNPTIENGTIVVQGGKIREMSANGPIPNDATNTFDVEGGYIMPGFIDAHAHWGGAWEAPYKVQADWEMFVNLAFGVTTLHNPSADTLSVFQDAELIRAGRKVGPRIFSTGKILYGAGGNYHCDIASLDDALNYLKTLQAVGAWSAKSYNQPCRAARQRILDAARSLKMNVVPEGGMSYYWNLNQIIDGHTTIEHSIPMAPLYNDVITLFAKSGTAWTPTFIVNYGGIFGERYWFQHTNVWEDERLAEYVPDDIVQPTTIRYVGAQDADYHHFATSRSVAAVFLNGGTVEAGAHGEMQGIGIHWEMQMFNQSGVLTPYQVLQTATINPAKALGLDSQIGSLAVGKLADLIFYNASNSPLTLHTENVNWVMKNGHLYNAFSMDQILPTPLARAPLPQLNTPVGGSLAKPYKRNHHHP